MCGIYEKERTEEKMLQVVLQKVNDFITWFDQVVWGPPLIVLILTIGIYLTVRMGFFTDQAPGKSTEVHG